ncbi:penicillin-binding protein activator [Paraurantiacibacter namhicola]|uniref:Penicillin-binding protein activator LpoA n=1 Tax=Paraurantiacibacter namhicola TaxID=645517 RepID=A0A1C7D9A0_9SPHN|nr:penicillin-binding protein activator [Paraurantiacibacter namhicola]ANU08005.1 Penicillin-binding protein activator LpoA [Paraurantiacibacter namhicola]
MLGSIKRVCVMAGAALLLAGCQVIPDSGTPRTVPEQAEPGPQGPTPQPSESALPQDQERNRVALLVPLSGPNGAVGQSIANATTMALLDTGADNIRLTVYDTATGAGTAAAEAISDGNRLILGPLMADNVTAVLAQARPAGIPLVTFSNDSSVATQDVFVMGHIPEQSVARTVDYAIADGSRRFAVLVPDGEYGRRVEIALADRVAAAGGTLVVTERYDRGNTSIISSAERLRQRGGFDTVLIADGARLSAMAAGSLKPEGGPLPAILGTELWSGEGDVTRASALRGARFSAVSDARFRQFTTSYEQRFGETPYRISTLGYDAVLLVLRISRDWEAGRPFPIRRMTDDGGFLGLDGAFRFRRDGVGERAFEVRQVGNGTVSVVSPAPQRFED